MHIRNSKNLGIEKMRAEKGIVGSPATSAYVKKYYGEILPFSNQRLRWSLFFLPTMIFVNLNLFQAEVFDLHNFPITSFSFSRVSNHKFFSISIFPTQKVLFDPGYFPTRTISNQARPLLAFSFWSVPIVVSRFLQPVAGVFA